MLLDLVAKSPVNHAQRVLKSRFVVKIMRGLQCFVTPFCSGRQFNSLAALAPTVFTNSLGKWLSNAK